MTSASVTSSTTTGSLLVPELGSNKEETGLEDAQACSDGGGIKVLDLQRADLLILVLDGDLEEVALLALQ
jgi:hypothetical protein